MKDLSFSERIHARIGERLHARILADRAVRPGFGPGQAAALILAFLVLLSPLAVLLAGLWVVWSLWPAVIGVFLGCLLVALGWALLPRVPRVPREALHRDMAPGLFALTDAVADHLGADRVDLIVVESEFNAWIARAGLRRHLVLGIGLPLWALSDDEERLALLAHEFAHDVNGDPLRHGVLGTAVATLDGWRFFLRPERSGDDVPGEFLGAILLSILYGIADLVRLIMVLCAGRAAQRAEYYADRLAVETAGSAALERLLLKIALVDVGTEAIDSRLRNWDLADEDAMQAATGYVTDMTPEMRAQMIDHAFRKLSRVDASHPPTLYRIEHARNLAVATPGLTVDPAMMAGAVADLAPLNAAVSVAMARDARSRDWR